MNEPRVVESIANECQSLGRAHESSSARAEQLIACLEGEIAKRDARILELESQYQRDVYGLNNEGDPIGGDPAGGYANDNARLRAELAAIKAQDPVAEIALSDDGYKIGLLGALRNHRLPIGTKLYAAPLSEAKAQGEYGDAYQGAREDLAIWKRRALEAEKALQEERIITERLCNALNEENGPTFMGEPVFPAKAQGVVPDEREEFEDAYSAEYGTPVSVLKLLREGENYIEKPQHSDRLNSSWWMWQKARACLNAAPAAPAADAGVNDHD